VGGKAGSAVQQRAERARHDETVVELERYRLLVESVQDYAIFLLDSEGYVLTWNKGAEKNKGYKANEIIGKHFSTFYLQRDRDAKKPERELELAKRFGRVEDEDWRVRKDGTQFWANVVITALFGQDGELRGFAKVTRDLTERKRHEENLRKANILLRRQQQELERLNRSKDEFISLASHQLRTPATGIKQFLGLIMEGFAGTPTPAQMSLIEKAYDSNEHQIAIVNSLLRVAQVDDGRLHLRKLPTDIQRLITEVAEVQAEDFGRRKQRVIVKPAKDLPKIRVDAEHFRMALENLVDNASKYTPDGGTITLQAKVEDGWFTLSVQDTGVGIAEADLPKLFRKFSRIPNGLSESVGGTGLGLYWVGKIIALHGGRIEVTSVVGKGTTFTIYIPIGQEYA
jgi:PAS domain S-box-containing protein